MIRVLVTDDHTVLRKGVAALLERERDMTAVGEAATADQAVIKARALQPDVILLDVVMPRKSGFDVLPELRKVAPEARVVMLSMQTNPSSIRQALNSGAAGYVAKHALDTDLLDAIRRVAAGSRYLDPELGSDLVVSDQDALNEPISERERDVLFLLALGYTNQEIATMLYISVRTVETHRAHIMQKLQLQTRAQLVLYALANGLIGPS
ncbi:MAG: two-component system, NarL family, response regulator NreC [Gaiellaceae bacterium]|jgi:DNA-binding NarL/FixJ family response regulator|nr:two-component system, NarL family, response regulator NreC [Gaiellaceae bacterium]